MKKILILSYFFPPCNLTASQRVYSFARYLHLFNYYPIIITRRWDKEVVKMEDANQLSEPTKKIVYHDNYEVHYLPYTGSKRDKLLSPTTSALGVLFRKALTLWEQLTQFFLRSSIPYANFYNEAVSLIEEHQIKQVIISVNPYAQFYFGYLLKKRFPKLHWFADYRDDWNTKELDNVGVVNKYYKKYAVHFEKKFVRTAACFFTTSNVLTNRIHGLLKIPGYTVQNGYFEESYENFKSISEPVNCFSIAYTGQLYKEQDFSIFIAAVKKLILENPHPIKITIDFIGVGLNDSSKHYLSELLKGFEYNYTIHPRMSYDACMELESKADVLLMVAYGTLKGIPSSKLYNYIGFKKPILLCPSDSDVIAETLTQCGVGYIATNVEEAYKQLAYLLDLKFKGALKQETLQKLNTFEIEKLSRKKQVELIANILDKH